MSTPSESGIHSRLHDKHLQAGSLVNGVTHELNNKLGVVLAYAQLIGFEDGLSQEVRKMLSDIEEAVRTGTRMLETMTYLTREKKTKPRRVEVEDVLERVREVYLFPMRNRHIEMDTTLDGDLSQVRVHEPSLIRALMYVFSNAIALQESRIHVSVSGDTHTITIRVHGSSQGTPEPPEDIERAREILNMQSGELDYDAVDGVTIRIPREPESLTEC